MGSVPPARCFDTHRAFADRGLPSRPKPDGGPPRAFAPVQRSIAAPPHRPADRSRHVGRCFLPWASGPYDTSRNGGPAFRGASGPAACHVRGLGTPLAASTTIPPDALRRRSVHRLPPPRRSPRTDRDSSRSPLPSWRCSRRFASPPWGACGRGRLQGVDPGADTCCPPHPCGCGASWPSWGSSFRAFPPLVLKPDFGSWGLPSHARRRYVSAGCVTGSCGAKGSAGPSRGCRLSWGSPPRDRRGVVPTGLRSGLMDSPHDSSAACGASRSKPRQVRPSRRRSADPSPAVPR